MPYINVYDNDYAQLTFDLDNINKIANAAKKRLTIDEQETFEELLDKLENIKIDNLDVYLRYVNVSEDDIGEAYDDYCSNGDSYEEGKADGYEEGYQDGINKVQKSLHTYHGCLLQKLEQIAYHYGNAQPLTDKDVREILDIINC